MDLKKAWDDVLESQAILLVRWWPNMWPNDDHKAAQSIISVPGVAPNFYFYVLAGPQCLFNFQMPHLFT